jgi:hypothetical protein
VKGLKKDAPLISAAGLVQSFKRSRGLPASLAHARQVLVKIINEDLWRAFYWPNETGPEVVCFASFEEFVTAPASSGGLAWSLEDLRSYVRGDAVATNALDRVTQRKAGGDTRSQAARTTVDNVNSGPVGRPSGNSSQRALRVLREKAPELHAKVLAGEMSANAAMVKGGFRKKTVTLTVEVESAARTLRKAFTKRQLRQLVRKLEDA